MISSPRFYAPTPLMCVSLLLCVLLAFLPLQDVNSLSVPQQQPPPQAPYHPLCEGDIRHRHTVPNIDGTRTCLANYCWADGPDGTVYGGKCVPRLAQYSGSMTPGTSCYVQQADRQIAGSTPPSKTECDDIGACFITEGQQATCYWPTNNDLFTPSSTTTTTTTKAPTTSASGSAGPKPYETAPPSGTGSTTKDGAAPPVIPPSPPLPKSIIKNSSSYPRTIDETGFVPAPTAPPAGKQGGQTTNYITYNDITKGGYIPPTVVVKPMPAPEHPLCKRDTSSLFSIPDMNDSATCLANHHCWKTASNGADGFCYPRIAQSSGSMTPGTSCYVQPADRLDAGLVYTICEVLPCGKGLCSEVTCHKRYRPKDQCEDKLGACYITEGDKSMCYWPTNNDLSTSATAADPLCSSADYTTRPSITKFTTETTCVSNGFCWNPIGRSSSSSSSPCYPRTPQHDGRMYTGSSCYVPVEKRIDAGWHGISRYQCQKERTACFTPVWGRPGPWCFWATNTEK